MTTMPAQATCCQCKREFPVKAVMSLSSGSIPMFVVVQEVVSVEEAMGLATCQLCLNKEGPKDRGLHAILVSLGCKEVQTPGAYLDPRVLPGNRKQEGPSMSGVRVALPRMPDKSSGPFRRPLPPREERLDDRPRMPKVLEKPAVRKPEPKAEPLKVGLDERSMAALKAAGAHVRERDEKKKYSRLGKFGARMKKLKHLLTFVREHAVHADVDAHVEKFYVIYTEALTFDPKQRSKKGLLERLGTSETQLEMLRVQFWSTHTIVPKKGSGDGGEGEGEDSYEARPHVPRCLVVGIKLEEVEDNPFPDGRRPRHFDHKGNEGRQATLRPVIVVRAQSHLPRVANKPLGEPEGPCPKIVYPEGGRYGSEYKVFWSRRLGLEDVVENLFDGFSHWLKIHHTRVGITSTLTRIDLSMVIDTYFRSVMEAPDAVMDQASVPSSQEDQPHAEV